MGVRAHAVGVRGGSQGSKLLACQDVRPETEGTHMHDAIYTSQMSAKTSRLDGAGQPRCRTVVWEHDGLLVTEKFDSSDALQIDFS